MKVYIVYEYYSEDSEYENQSYENIVCIYGSKDEAQKNLKDIFYECLKEDNKYGAMIYYESCRGDNINHLVIKEDEIKAEVTIGEVGVYIKEYDVL